MANSNFIVPDLFARIVLLKRSAVFSDVATDDLRVVANELKQEGFAAGDRVFNSNELATHMYIIETGSVGISLGDKPVAKKFIAKLGPGDCFGEMGMLDDLPRSATAHVLKDCQCLILEKSGLQSLISRYPDLAHGILRSMSHRLREANAEIESQQ